MTRRHSRLRSAMIWLLATLAMTLGLAALIEGAARLLLFTNDVLRYQAPVVAERPHTAYDPLLGWSNLPNVDIPDHYGPGRGIRTDRHGFRSATGDVPDVPPVGRIRVVCSGDSFTLGYGVGNSDTWCHWLSVLDARIEPVNMSEGGYGVDQAYLWYVRDGLALRPRIHLFTFISFDFDRMEYRTELWYGKPILVLRGDSLVTENVPVPMTYLQLRTLRPRFEEPASRLGIVELMQRLARRIRGTSAAVGHDASMHANERTLRVAFEVFKTLDRLNRDVGSQLVLVYLPTRDEYMENPNRRLRETLRVFADSAGLPLVDLVDDFWRAPPEEVSGMFIRPGEVTFYEAAGHYNEAGNHWVANTLLKRLGELPALRSILSPAMSADVGKVLSDGEPTGAGQHGDGGRGGGQRGRNR